MHELLMGREQMTAIKRAIEQAHAKPVPWEWLQQHAAPLRSGSKITLADRPPNFRRPPAVIVLIPDGYSTAICFEEQPDGIVRHLSVSIEGSQPGAVPNVSAFTTIAVAFGFTCGVPPMSELGKMWTEEFAPGKLAINIAQIE